MATPAPLFVILVALAQKLIDIPINFGRGALLFEPLRFRTKLSNRPLHNTDNRSQSVPHQPELVARSKSIEMDRLEKCFFAQMIGSIVTVRCLFAQMIGVLSLLRCLQSGYHLKLK
jgi:hypothetical protein